MKTTNFSFYTTATLIVSRTPIFSTALTLFASAFMSFVIRQFLLCSSFFILKIRHRQLELPLLLTWINTEINCTDNRQTAPFAAMTKMSGLSETWQKHEGACFIKLLTKLREEILKSKTGQNVSCKYFIKCVRILYGLLN